MYKIDQDPVSLFFDIVRSDPDHPAVVSENDTMNYGQLGSLTSRIAYSISMFREDARVLIYLPKSAEAYAAMFGTLMAGGYYSPINMDAPLRRHIEILRQFKPNIIISDTEHITKIPANDLQANVINISELSYKELESPGDPHELAYVIFTSGSTGEPKGVMIPRKALENYISWAVQEMKVTSKDRWSQHPNIAFDLSVLDIYGALCGGATLYPLVTQKDKLLPANFIKTNGLTIWNSVPSVIDLMIKARQTTEKYFSSLRLVTFCGEPLHRRHLDALFQANKNLAVHNTYGPTEATVSCTLLKLTADDYLDYCDTSVAIGKPISGMNMILGEGDNNEGELILYGEQLAAGYWKSKVETEKSFKLMQINNIERRVYLTGDWVTKKNNQYHFSSRIDDQIKIRGNRVELDEIDSVINKLGYGTTCTIYKNNKLYSFFEAAETPVYSEFKQRVSEYLPDYEIPNEIYAIPGLPTSINDKIDRKKLFELVKSTN